jgi:acid stress-induced BolA-like protein IbaG/YrbA
VNVSDFVKLLETQIPGAQVFAQDLTGEGNHFDAVVVSATFANQSRINRHRMVMAAVQNQWDGGLHAFTFKTYTPEEWEKV